MRRPDIITAVLTAMHTLIVCQGRSNAGGWLRLVKGDSQVEALWHTAGLDRRGGVGLEGAIPSDTDRPKYPPSRPQSGGHERLRGTLVGRNSGEL